MAPKRQVGRPTLPSAILKTFNENSELKESGSDEIDKQTSGVRGRSRKELRMDARKAKKQKIKRYHARSQVEEVLDTETTQQHFQQRSETRIGKAGGMNDAKKLPTKRKAKELREEVTTNKTSKTKFEELLELEKKGQLSWEDDLELERQMAKKLKVKDGKLPGDEDLLNILLGYSDDETEGFIAQEAEDMEEDLGEWEEDLEKEVEEDLEELEDDLENEVEEGEEDDLEALRNNGNDGEDISEDEEETNDAYEQGGKELVGDEMQENEEIELELAEEGRNSFRYKDGRDNDDKDDDADFYPGEEESKKDQKLKKVKHRDSKKENKAVNKIEIEPLKYVAPHLRRLEEGEKSEEMLRVERKLRGLLNRLAESNLEKIAGEVSEIFQSHGRSVIGKLISEEILSACVGGPRGNEQYAAVFAAFIAGIASTSGVDFGANFVSNLAQAFEEQYSLGDTLALRNLTLLFSFLYNFSLLSSDVVYNFLQHLCDRFQEQDVASILHLLQACGMSLRSDDPQAMKDFIITVQTAAANSLQALKIKAQGDGGEGKPGVAAPAFSKRVTFMLDTIVDIKNNRKRREEAPQHTKMKKWLQKLRVEEAQLRVLTWQRLLETDKRGQWWLPAPAGVDGPRGTPASLSSQLADTLDADVASSERLLQLAASQRMNTDARRSIFCCVMDGEDYVDGFEKLLRLKLPGKQDREILRVVLECCLQESVFNPYYALLAVRLCNHDRNHKFTLQVKGLILISLLHR